MLGSAQWGGTETNVHHLVGRMGPSFLNHVCFLSSPGPVGDGLSREGIDVCYFPLSSVWSLPRVAFQLLRRLRKTRYDILHLYGLRANILGRLLGRLTGYRIILGALRSVYPAGIKRRWVLWLDRFFFALSTGYVSNSQAAIDFLVAHGFDRRKFWLIHSGIDVEPFRRFSGADDAAGKREFGVSPNALVVSCVANLRPPKGHAYLIKALAQMPREELNLKLLNAGDGPLRGDLERLARKHGLAERVVFLGSVDRGTVLELLRITDVFVLPSLSEGLPMAVLEAMAAGCPVLATAVGGTPELVIHDKTGLLVNPRDPSALAEGLLVLAKSEETRRRMGTAGRKRVEESFLLGRMVGEYETLYTRMVGREES